MDGQYSVNNRELPHDAKFMSRNKNGEDQDACKHIHNLQHISEREPDDVETDPSSNPLNRPIFAARSTCSRNKSINQSDSYSSPNSIVRKHSILPLLGSRDYGYNSTLSTSTTHDCHLIDTLDNSIQNSLRATGDKDYRFSCEKSSLCNNSTSILNSPINSQVTDLASSDIGNPNHSNHSPIKGQVQKSSSCSTIYIDGSTISQPDLKQTIKCVSLAIYYHIKNRTSDNSADIFNEQIHPLKMPMPSTDAIQDELIVLDQNDSCRFGEPNQRTIYSFVKTLFRAAQLTSEYAITTLVYLERLMTYAEMDLTPRTWRRMFLGAILLSSKVWEDQAVWNVDYAQILEEISVEDINELERQFLELIQFNMNVPSSVYAKYYFHLRTLALKNGLSQDYSLLTVSQAKTLEVSSNNTSIHRFFPYLLLTNISSTGHVK